MELERLIRESNIWSKALFRLAATLLSDQADTILVIHFGDNPCLTFKTLLLGMIIVNIEGILAPDPGCDLLLT